MLKYLYSIKDSLQNVGLLKYFVPFYEFDPSSGWTLKVGFTHASWTDFISSERVRNE